MRFIIFQMNLLDDTIKPDLKIKGYTFIFKEVDLIITKSNWFGTKEIKKLPYESLDSIALKRPSSDNLFILKILINLLAALIFQVSPAISNNTHILFNYHVVLILFLN